ncbi:hypothetical protein WMY93_011357 [Mugilogobius chulae]|uniref:Uncharacterized protein n=1 Tax=Mugilogobius chulae TaxID=88201 RepID=A0AAW0P5M6_9GOBI
MTSVTACPLDVNGAEYRALVSVALSLCKWPVAILALIVSRLQNKFSTLPLPHMLTENEEHWLSKSDIVNRTERLCANVSPKGLSLEHLTATRLLSSVTRCIIGSSLCMDLADYSENGWPQGGTGHPVALRGIHMSDMASCQPMLLPGFYTDTPVSSHCQPADTPVLIAVREIWKVVALSFWYLPFIDSSGGNRTCWLDRPMLNDTHSNYRVPECNSRGLCEPLEMDNRILTDCQVNEHGELSLECQVFCGDSCFGPICYNLESETYTRELNFQISKIPSWWMARLCSYSLRSPEFSGQCSLCRRKTCIRATAMC